MSLRAIARMYADGQISTTEVLDELSRRVPGPLAEGQRGLWVLSQMEPDTYAYNVPICFVCQNLDSDVLEAAFRDTLVRHPLLAATIREADQGPYLAYEDADAFSVERVDISGVPSDQVLDELRRRARQPFELAGGPLIRLVVLRRSASEAYVLLVVHHIVIDGASGPLVIDALFTSYRARSAGQAPPFTATSASFGEFVQWEQEALTGARGALDREFWQRELAGAPPLTGLPSQKALPPDAPHEGEIHTRRLSGEQADAVAAFTAARGIGPGSLFLAVFTALLHRYTGQEDIVIGMPVPGRPEERFDSVVGYFVNTLPIRIRPTDSDEFAGFADRVQSTVFQVLEHAAYPFHRIVRDLGTRGKDLRSPVYQVVYNYQDSALSGHFGEGADDEFRLVDGLYQAGEYDLTLDVVPSDGVVLNWKFHPDAFSADAVVRMADHFVAVLDDVIASDGRVPLGRLNLLPDAERRLLLEEWNLTAAEYPAEKTCWDLFAEQADANPDSAAVTCEDQSLSYRELADRAAALAEALARRGVGTGDIVGICFERSLDLVVGLLAVMKAGAAYVPLDAGLPAERLSYMIEDSGARLVVCHEAVLDKLAAVDLHGAEPYPIDRRELPRQDHQDLQDSPGSAPALAYVIYTSGSTGKPKGVAVPHRALTNFLTSMARTLDVTADDRLLAVTTSSFDIAALELYLPLITGGQVCVSDAGTAADATLLADKIAAWRPTVMQATPATWAMLVRVGWQNTEGVKVLCGGEALPDSLKDQLVARGETWNLYGPTETTIWSTAKRLHPDEPVTIGRPIANTRTYILDQDLNPVPVGVSGELYIAGDGVALGYHGKPELTAERFLDDPFAPGRIYRTGDLARRLPNGEITLLGRMDNQIKLRGYRVELGEIEAVLNSYPGITRSIVVVEHTGPSDRLSAYYTGDAIDSALLRAHLAKALPRYMVPAAFVALDAFPLTTNGKVDRAKLSQATQTIAPIAADQAVHADSGMAGGDTERTVHRILADVLGSKDIDRDAGFFDIGGDSFLAIEAVAAINRTFGTALRPTSLFAHPSVTAMARHLTTVLSPSRAPEPHQPERRRDASELDDSIAVIGISCRFPGAPDHRAFWRELMAGHSGSTTWSPEELRALGVPEGLLARSGYVPQRSVVEGRAEFDAAFFGISPRDAELMDPQARLLLQHAWQALEDAGYRPEDVPDTSVVTSTSTNFYQALLPHLMANASGARVLADPEVYAAWLFAQGGTVPTMISTKLGLRGASLAVSTNCSSALSALHLACQGLTAGEADQALVGAASLFSAGELGYVHQPGLNFSSDGRSRAFADGADGMSGGEGVGVVLLKRARDAIADGDHVYCLIRGVAVNNDGGDKAGFYAPSVRGQADVIRKALDKAGVDPATIRYVEAHGTGTRLGDPIEVAALTQAYRHYTDRTGYCAIGSVKSNIGHLDAAAGIAGLIKVALALEHGEVPRTLHCDVPSSEIDWDDSPFFVADRNLRLDGAEPARAGLSSFGIGGTNVHAVLEQVRQGSSAVGRPEQPERPGPYAVVLSARDGERLGVLTRQLLEFLPEYRDAGGDLTSLAYTLQVGRRAMAERVVFVAGGFEALIAQLQGYVANGAAGSVFEGSARRSDDELVGLFARTAELQQLAAQWLERGEWSKLAPLWVNGVDLDWRVHYGLNSPTRVSLPTYPFAPKRYWPAAQPRSAVSLAGAASPPDIAEFLDQRVSAAQGMDEALRPLVLAQLVTIGLFREPVHSDRIDPAGLVADAHRQWLDHTVTVLLDGGELLREGGRLKPRAGAPDLEHSWRTWREWKNTRSDDPESTAKANLTERMVEALPAILIGESAATGIMFPSGSFELVAPVYRGNATADYFNDVTAAAVRAEADRAPGATRILEIGAGTGSTSERVFAQLTGSDIAEYRYTDISKAFLIDAERRFGGRVPYLTFSTFDVERAPGAQGLAVGGYDIVIANNVLHATRDIRQTAAHVRALLRPGGVLVLNELARNEWWQHLTFGLLEGWWRPTDGRRIEGGPALSAEAWREVLREQGFDAIEQLAESARVLGQQVVLARAGAATRHSEAGPDRAARPEATPAASRPVAAGSLEVRVRGTIEQLLIDSLKLGPDELAADKPFADYGLDSLTGVTVVNQLNEALGTDLDPSVLFENPSVSRLARFVIAEEGDTLRAVEPVPAAPAPVKPASPSPTTKEPIAIIGMSGRFPGARDVDEFWDLLISGRDPVSRVSRWDVAALGSTCVDGGFLDGVEEFDPLFFGISGAEAAYMEPQQRLFLQEAWRALEDAGHAGDSFDRDRCGVYVGCAAGDYLDLTAPSEYPGQAFWGNMNSLVPSRIAYYLDLHGPAMAVDTACSSSLVSLYLACQGLWTGETAMAIAGGVYVQNSPRLYLAGSRAGMLSPTGRCRSFDQAADGFVPAEGVGALVLKRLSDAEADGDHVHGVISGIGINQNGTTNGIVAPNGTAQERLIRQVYEDFGIDAAGIGLVEAHGTGTKLGDPVEFRALDRAFRSFTDREEFCSLGSSKAAIGHAQAAAGVIGVIKALLAIRHAAIPGLPHYKETNSSVALAGSPFFVHTEPRDWEVTPGGRRRAAVTSLGASGTNAHAVIEEAPAVVRRSAPDGSRTTNGPRLIVLSGATENALREQVARLGRHCRAHPELELADVSYTLLLGRRHLRHRWACVVQDIAELVERCESGARGAVESTDPTFRALAAEFVGGGTPDFGALFRDGHYRRVPLPGYAFEREHYSMPRPTTDHRPVTDHRPAGQKILTGDEFYLREHQVQGSAIAPGAMFLQWACAAARQAGDAAVRLSDVVFLRPLTISGGNREIQVNLGPDGRFEVSSTMSAGDPVVHCQGRFASVPQSDRQVLDLPVLLRDFNPTAFDPERFYAEWRERGIDYGPSLRGVVAVHRRDGAVLAQLRLPEAVAGTLDDFALHPSLLDSAMQCMRFLDDGDRGGLVFAIKSVEALAPCSATMWARVRRADRSDRIDIDLLADDGTICLRLQGIAGRRTEPLPTPASTPVLASDPSSAAEAVTLLPVWDPVSEPETPAWPHSGESVGIIAASPQARAALSALYPAAHMLSDEKALSSAPELNHLLWVAPEARGDRPAVSIVADQATGTLHAYRTIKALLEAGYGDKPLGLTLITQRAHAVYEAEHVDPTHAGVAGLAGSAAKEYPNWRIRVADLDVYDRHAFDAVVGLPADPNGNLRIRRDGRWHRQQLMTVRPAAPAVSMPSTSTNSSANSVSTKSSAPSTSSPFRTAGTYVIVGGAGGLGTVISEHLIRRYRAQVVWLGRSPLDARIESAIATAAASGGPAPRYLQADATDADSLRAAREEIVRRFGPVRGVIHSGLVLSGASLARMSDAQFEDVLRGKVDASVRLLEVFGAEPLDFALFLSSINSYLKAIKQANYAAACTFLDSFALGVRRRHGVAGKVLNLGYCFNNAPSGGEVDRGAVVGADAPLIQPDELTAAIERLCAAPVSRLTLMKFSPALNNRGIVVGEDEVVLPAATSTAPPPEALREPPAVFSELELVRARTAQLTALTI